VLDVIYRLLGALLELIFDWTRRHPELWIPVVLAIARSFGTTVQTGSTGVLYVWGRAKKTLEPGFHWLIPIVQQARSTLTRSITLDLPRQRVTTADGLVYDVDATLVYRVDDPIRCLVEIDDVKQGCMTVLPLALEELMRRQTQASLADRQTLDAAFADKVRARLAQWGVEVEQAGLVSIAPTRSSLRLTQLRLRTRERQRALESYARQGLSLELALALLGTSRQPIAKSAHRYRKRRRLLRKLLQSEHDAGDQAERDPMSEFMRGLFDSDDADQAAAAASGSDVGHGPPRRKP
jgi:regulator of protease activity HflC (stomatin/prohibitin superfamily)